MNELLEKASNHFSGERPEGSLGEMPDNPFGKLSRISFRAENQEGRTILRDLSFTAPYKIMAPFQKPDGGIRVMPLCASAGIMKGDRQEFTYRVGEYTNLEILSQSFEKIHRMEGGCAQRNIYAEAAPHSVFCYYPQPVLPYAGSAFDSTMEIRLADETSRFFLLEIISCGRSARGERFQYRRFSSRVRVYRGGRLIYHDNTRCEPERMPMEGIGMYEGYSHMANIFLTSAGSLSEEKLYEILQAFPECDGGITRLASGDMAVRAFAHRAQLLQNLAERLKEEFQRSAAE